MTTFDLAFGCEQFELEHGIAAPLDALEEIVAPIGLRSLASLSM